MGEKAREIRQRGVIIDIGHGVGAFSFEVARALLEQGFFPDTIRSDIHILGLQGPTYAFTIKDGRIL